MAVFVVLAEEFSPLFDPEQVLRRVDGRFVRQQEVEATRTVVGDALHLLVYHAQDQGLLSLATSHLVFVEQRTLEVKR